MESHLRGYYAQVQFMKKAVEEVDKCRMTLKWTYAMAYYLAKGNEKDLFEDNQRYANLLAS
jgi:ariadne-1